ncbi:MAG TPA: hypothetical protein DHW61_14045 [Lachnoclostridium phytofermentans]|uniref:Uncharacterized protein n=1 Tax=Lachnoclostridium phytofermentans TaxID=66219 RepID=A0A3D2X9V5_9FIRM|nr:hypothetical protein [Lachnoclostridium sp.]HCL03507.1 hypothetical protein [Lachnoclostridium phytofermentans]
MKLYHYAIIFVIIGIAFITIQDINYQEMIMIRVENAKLNAYFNQAVDAGTSRLEKKGGSCVALSKELATASFFQSMYASLGILEDEEQKERFMLSIPIITIIDYDGVYVNYCVKETMANGKTMLKRAWTEKIPYRYSDELFEVYFTLSDVITLNVWTGTSGKQNLSELIDEEDKEYGYIESMNQQNGDGYWIHYQDLQRLSKFSGYYDKNPSYFIWNETKFLAVQRATVTETIEDIMKYYVDNHVEIAKEFGISYEFHLPLIDNSNWDRAIGECSIFVLFQGYPYQSTPKRFYNRHSFHAAEKRNNITYFLERKSWYLLYHKEECPDWISRKENALRNGEILEDILCESLEECSEYGAFPCLKCNSGYEGYHPER